MYSYAHAIPEGVLAAVILSIGTLPPIPNPSSLPVSRAQRPRLGEGESLRPLEKGKKKKNSPGPLVTPGARSRGAVNRILIIDRWPFFVKFGVIRYVRCMASLHCWGAVCLRFA